MPDTLPTLSRQTLTTVIKQHHRVLIITTVIGVSVLHGLAIAGLMRLSWLDWQSDH